MTQTRVFSIVKKTIEEFNFPKFVWVYCRPTVADLFKPTKRCGIYVLRFTNNQFYVGQAVDVIRRFVQHVKTHNDIQEITFKTFPIKDLDNVERHLIKSLESKKVRLRNINLTSIPKGDTDLDLVIPGDQQQTWLQSNQVYELKQHIVLQPELQEKYSRRFRDLIKREEFIYFAKPFLIQYFKKCILDPAKTELTFWSLTCLNKAFSDTNHIALSRLNLFWCEILTIWINDEKKISYTFHLTKSLLTKSYLKSLKIKTLFIYDHFYQRGGSDQFSIEVTGLENALKLLNDEKVLMAIKTFNLRQMQKGATVFSKYHCIDLAKLILTDDVS